MKRFRLKLRFGLRLKFRLKLRVNVNSREIVCDMSYNVIT
jgi:hypothetical protein